MDETKVKDVFARHIIRLRKNRNMTQGEFADLLEVGVSTVSDWETAKKLPRAGAIERLARTFNISKSSLFEEENEKNPDPLANEKEFLNSVLDLSDNEIKEKFSFKVDGRDLSQEEYDRMIAAVRSERLYKNQNNQ